MTTYNEGKTLEQALRDEFEELYDSEQIAIWNTYCDENSMFEDIILPLNDDVLNEALGNMTPAKAIYAFRYARHDARYFTYDGDTVETFDHPDESSSFDEDNLIDWLMTAYHWELRDIRRYLDVYEDDEEDEEDEE